MVFHKIFTIFEMIKFEHSVFALPFAYMGMILAKKDWPTLWQVFWITLAMVGARSFAMATNRYVDRKIDALNPRTRNWPLPQRRISEGETILFALASLALFFGAISQLAPLCRYLWPVVVLPMVLCPYTKRFTPTSHFLLGICLGLAPLGAGVAVTNHMPSFDLIILGGAVTLWAAGFDIIYSLQDVEFDRKANLHSLPVKLGTDNALKITKILHTFTTFFLIILGIRLSLGAIYYLGVALVALFLWYENHLVKLEDLSRINISFFTMNGLVSIFIFLFTMADKING